LSSEEIWYKLNSIAYKLYLLNLEFTANTSRTSIFKTIQTRRYL
jgi:hypothetical protein